MASLPLETIVSVCNNISNFKSTYEQYKFNWKSLNDQRQEGVFCDVIIKCKEQTFQAHKCVLATASGYFKTLFLSPLSACDIIQIANLNDFSKQSIELFLDFIYDQPKVERVDIADVLKLAHYLQYDLFAETLLEAIRANLDDTNCSLWYKIATECCIDKLIILVNIYIKEHYLRLIRTETNKSLALFINNPPTQTDSIFNKKVIFYHNNKSIVVIDVLKKTSNEYKTGPCCISKLPTQIVPEGWFEELRILSFFTFRNVLHLVCSFIHDTKVGYYRHTKIQMYSYNQFSKKYACVYDVAQHDILFDGNLCIQSKEAAYGRAHESGFVLNQVVYNNGDDVYMLFQSDVLEEAVIYKFDLVTKCFSKNYISLNFQINTKYIFAESKQLGTLLMQGLEVYNIEEYNFMKNVGSSEFALQVDVQSQIMNNPNRKSKEDNRFGKPYTIWNTMSLNGVIYFFAVFQNSTTELSVLQLNVEHLLWIHLCDLSLSGSFINVFHCQEKMFIVQSSVKCGSHCSNECNSLQPTEEKGVYDSLYYFNPDKKTLTDMDIRLPLSNVTAFQAFSVPAHVLV